MMNLFHKMLTKLDPPATPLIMTPHASSNNEESVTKQKVNESVKDLQHGSTAASAIVDGVILKIPPLTVIYWCEKMTATTFGETFADYFTQTLAFGYTVTSIVLIAFFAVTLAIQLKVRSYRPIIFWLVMASSSVAGTCVSDFIDRTLEWGYPLGMGVLLGILIVIIASWKLSGEHMNVAGSITRLAEAFYWSTILTSNTLGTALGDFTSDSLGLGFAASAGIFGAILAVCAFLAYFTKVSHVVLFWVAFVVTRPFGATFGDLLTKGKSRGGLDLGTLNASLVIFGLFLICFGIEMHGMHKAKAMRILESKKEADDDIAIEAAVIDTPEESGKNTAAEEGVDHNP